MLYFKHAKRKRTHLGRRKVVCSWDNLIFSRSYHLLKLSLIEDFLLTAQSTSAHYALMICRHFQSALFDCASTDTNFSTKGTVQVHMSYFSPVTKSWFLSGQESRNETKDHAQKTFKGTKRNLPPLWSLICKCNLLHHSFHHIHICTQSTHSQQRK